MGIHLKLFIYLRTRNEVPEHPSLLVLIETQSPSKDTITVQFRDGSALSEMPKVCPYIPTYSCTLHSRQKSSWDSL